MFLVAMKGGRRKGKHRNQKDALRPKKKQCGEKVSTPVMDLFAREITAFERDQGGTQRSLKDQREGGGKTRDQVAEDGSDTSGGSGTSPEKQYPKEN